MSLDQGTQQFCTFGWLVVIHTLAAIGVFELYMRYRKSLEKRELIRREIYKDMWKETREDARRNEAMFLNEKLKAHIDGRVKGAQILDKNLVASSILKSANKIREHNQKGSNEKL